MARSVAFRTVDVFTDRPFGGNPLAVFLDADDLSPEEMQAIAGETNLSETVFVLRPADPAHAARLRIFVPRHEIPFAGHPNVGTAFVLAHEVGRAGRPVPTGMVFEEAAGLVEVTVETDAAGAPTGARIVAPRPLAVGDALEPDLVAACLSLPREALRTDRHPPLVASVGLPFALAELASLETLAEARPDPGAFAEADRRHPHPDDRLAILAYVPGPDGLGHDARARMFGPLSGIPEDPATGSAGGALVGLLASLRPEVDAEVSLRLGQGVEMGRPSALELRAVKRAGRVDRVEIGGGCVAMSEGTMRLP